MTNVITNVHLHKFSFEKRCQSKSLLEDISRETFILHIPDFGPEPDN